MDAEKEGQNGVATSDEHTALGAAAAATPPAVPAQVESPALADLLEIAEAYFAAGAIHQAMEIYFELVSEHGGAPEGMQAGDRLMNIARRYVSAGMLHQARAIYERLM